MKLPVAFLLVLALLLVSGAVQSAPAQDIHHDKAVMASPPNEFLDSLRMLSGKFDSRPKDVRKRLLVDFSAMKLPASLSEFTVIPHAPPISQAISGMCWCFSGTSFFESEITRITGKTIKLSEVYTVYWEYVEKAKRFVRERGNSAFGEGSEANAVPRIWKEYGIVPASAYTGLPGGRPVHDHTAMIAEMRKYLNSVKDAGAWDESAVIGVIRSIMDHYIGAPPERVTVDGRSLTPREYLANVVRLNLDDYASLQSLMELPYFELTELDVQDNWWHSKDYCNVPLDLFMATIKNAVAKGYTVALGGDTSEPGIEGHAGVAIIPTFDIPADYIDEAARNFRFRNGTTGDDHGIHVVGFKQDGGQEWFLVKDSGSGSRNNAHPGYYFFREDFVRLKMLTVLVHKDAAKEVLARMAK
jgi:bleomycin hydrolase